MIVAFEGIDASGKMTQAKLFVEMLRIRGLSVYTMSFPNYKTETGALIKTMLRRERSLMSTPLITIDLNRAFHLRRENALVLQALMTVNRYESINELTNSSSNGVLVLDRYWASGYAYGIADGLDSDWLLSIHRALPQPDLSIFCDVTVEESFRRRPVREDAYEACRGRLERAREVYIKLAVQEPEHWHVTAPDGTMDSIHAEITKRFLEVFDAPA